MKQMQQMKQMKLIPIVLLISIFGSCSNMKSPSLLNMIRANELKKTSNLDDQHSNIFSDFSNILAKPKCYGKINHLHNICKFDCPKTNLLVLFR